MWGSQTSPRNSQAVIAQRILRRYAGDTDTQIVDDITYAECLKLSQKIDEASRIIDETIQKCQSDTLRLNKRLSKSY